MRSASSIAPASASPGSVTALTKPHSAPCSAVKLSPVSASSSAFWYGIRRGSRSRPPPAATKPRLTSGIPNFAVRDATTRSVASTTSVPPAKAYPSTAAISGFRGGRSVNPIPRPGIATTSPAANAFRSIPEQKLPPAPVMIATERSSLLSSSSTASARPWLTARFTAFRASGRLIVMTRMRPRRSRNISSDTRSPSPLHQTC